VTAERPTADEISDRSGVPLSTTYRKLDLLTEASLLEEVAIALAEDREFEVAIAREPRTADERLADLWSEVPKETRVHTPIAIAAPKTITPLLGALITYFSYRAYQRTGAPPLGYLSVGFGIVTVGVLLAGVIDQVFDAGFRVGQVVESALIAVGFAIIVYSLFVRAVPFEARGES